MESYEELRRGEYASIYACDVDMEKDIETCAKEKPNISKLMLTSDRSIFLRNIDEKQITVDFIKELDQLEGCVCLLSQGQ